MKGAGTQRGERALYGQGDARNAAEKLALETPCLGQNCPSRCLQPERPGITFDPADPLGAPLGVREVAAMIGVSVWTIRQQYLPRGLPHARATPQGKLLFYKHQIIAWLLKEQRKGGTSP